MLNPTQINLIQEQLKNTKNPLFFFDDDPDGLCSFLILYNMNKEGHGIMVKSQPFLDQRYLPKVKEYLPDTIFILDMPLVSQEFIDGAKLPIFWLDHHSLVNRDKVHYFNPRAIKSDIYLPTTYMAYQISQNPQDLWLAVVGCISDYHLPDFLAEFSLKYPDLVEKNNNIESILYQTTLGKLVRLFSFILKGTTSEVNKCIKILTRISSPYEILKQETSSGKYLYKKFEKIEQRYLPLLAEAQKIKTKKPVLVFVYTEKDWSFTAELSAELLNNNPDKVIIVARNKSGEMKCSLRSRQLPISAVLEKALVGIEGYGGGHEKACGANIKETDWNQFLENFNRELKK